MNPNISSIDSWEFLSILDSVNDAVFIDDSQGITLWCNKACREMYKINPEDVIGAHVKDLEKAGIFSPSVACLVLEQKREVTIIHENIEGRKLLSTGTPIFDNQNNLRKIITTSRDITELSIIQTRLESMGQIPMDPSITNNMGIVAASNHMAKVLQLAKRLSTVDSTVLITGESGVGKGVIAKFLHESGDRSNQPFITVNCGAIPENLIESELFGYDKGAFTGAKYDGKIGIFEAAEKGTVFLDEISELPLNLQVKLLQVIQERYITKIGSTKKIPIDVRIISATNKDLHQLVMEKKFREDLYYRLNVVPIYIPALRHRTEDIQPLVKTFLDRYNKKYKENKSLTIEAMDVLTKFNWPGNIRELENIVERLILTTSEDLICPVHLPDFIIKTTATPIVEGTENLSLSQSIDNAEKTILTRAMTVHKSTRAIAKALQVSQPTIVRKLQKHGLTRE